MANNSSEGQPVAVGLTEAELWIHMTVFYVFLCGILSTIGNALICAAIIRTKHLQRRFFVIVCGLSICRGLLSLQYLIMGVYRILRTVSVAPAILQRLACHAVHFWLFVGFSLELALLLILVLERAMALVSADVYRRMTRSQAVNVCVGTYVIMLLIKLPPSYAQVDPYQMVACVNSYSPCSDSFNLYTQNIDIVLLSLILLAYICLMIYVRVRVRATMLRADTGNNAAAQMLKRQVKLLPIMRNLVLTHSTLALIPKVLRSLAGIYDDRPDVSARLTGYGGLFTTIDLFVNVVILLWSNLELRVATLSCCFANASKIWPMQVTILNPMATVA